MGLFFLYESLNYCSMASLKVGTFNVGGIHSPVKRKKILLYLKKLHIDIAYLQETHLLPPEVAKLGAMGWRVLASAPFTSKARGVVTLIRTNHDVTIHFTLADPQGRYSITDVSLGCSRFILCNVYAPNNYSKEFFLHILSKLYSLGDVPLIFGGDFNIVSMPKLDRSSSCRKARIPRVGIQYMTKRLHLLDIWRTLHPLERDFTCLSAAHGTLSRIDHLLISDSLFSRVIETSIEPICISDHALCWVRIALNVERGTHRQWRFPSHLSNSVKFREMIVSSWQSYVDDNAEYSSHSPLMFWQASKAVLRGQILSYTTHRDKHIRKSFAEVQNQLSTAFVLFKDSPSLENKTSYLAHKAAFDALLAQMESKHTFHARARFHRLGNRPGKILSRLLKGQHPSSVINRLRKPDGSLAVKGGEVSAVLQTFYADLYKCSQIDKEAKVAFWDRVTLPKLSDTHAASLVKPISEEEVRLAIKHLKNNKAPGPDGLSNDFYKILAPQISSTLMLVFNAILLGQEVPLYFNSALLKVLHKPGRDPELPASYRPISLLNSDYKLLTKIIADRLKCVIPHVVHEDQTGFIPGRHSVTNVRKVLAAMQWLEHHTSEGPSAILSLDAEKAFDLVAWDHLFETLLRFGAPVEFTCLLQRLYLGSSSQILSNGFISDPFSIQQGTRQGCPLSPLLFALAIEPLAIALREDPEFQGISVGGKVLKLSMFADDMLLFISNPVKSLQSIISTIDQFSAFAGFRVNYSKSNLLPLASDASFFSSHPALTKFAISLSPLKYLGVYIPQRLIMLYKANFTPVIQAITRSLLDWRQLPISISGRIAVIKSILFPKLSYVLQMLPLLPSKNDLSALRLAFSGFIWQGKRPRVAYAKLILPRDKGGYGLPDVLTFSQTILFRHISDWLLGRSSFSNYQLEEALFAPYSPSALLHLPNRSLPSDIKDSILFAGTYNSWCAINSRLQRSSTESRYTTFWGNPRFSPGLDNSKYQVWKVKGISAIRDIFDPGGTIYSFDRLKALYNVPNSEFFMYLQARHFAQSTLTLLGDEVQKDALTETMAWIKARPFKIKLLYPSLLEPMVTKAWMRSFAGWRLDLPNLESPAIWIAPCGMALKCLPSAALQETHLHTLQRAYISPSQRKHMVPEETGECKKCGAADANFFHCFWDCSKVKRFWNKLIGFINTTFSIKVSKLPIPCLFLNFAEWSLSPQERKLNSMLTLILTIAKQCILYHWIHKTPPFIHEVKDRLLSIIYFERQKVFPDIEKGAERFCRKWEVYINSLPHESQVNIQKVFETTAWYQARQLE